MTGVAGNSAQELDIRKVAGRIGAQISGVRLSADLPERIIAAIDAALVRYKVIFLRDQHHLDEAAQEAIAARFGEPFKHPTQTPFGDTDYTLELDSRTGERANVWHTDITFVAAYPKASMLRAVTIPPYGGDTMWANTAAGYESLPAPIRTMADSLRAIHANIRPHIYETPINRERSAAFHSRRIEAEHPVVRVHPDSGEPSLVLGNFVERFVGLDMDASARVFDLLQSYVLRPENIVRWQWREGDVAIWDNRATQHYALADYDDQRRVMRRVTIAGDIPVGLDGVPSCSRDDGPA